MDIYEAERLENYEQLRVERGWSHATMSAHLQGLDPKLAAKYRDQHGVKAAEAPVGRSEGQQVTVTPNAPKGAGSGGPAARKRAASKRAASKRTPAKKPDEKPAESE